MDGVIWIKKFACQLILVLLPHSIWYEQSCMLGSSITKNYKKILYPNIYRCSGDVFNSNLFIYLCSGAFLLGQAPMDNWTLSIEQVSSTLADHNVCTKNNNINATWNWHFSELFLPRAMSCACQQTKTHFRAFHCQICLEGIFQCACFGILFLRLVLIFGTHSRRSCVILVRDLLSEHLSTPLT